MKPNLNVHSYESEAPAEGPSFQSLKTWLITARNPSLGVLNERIRQLHYLSCTDDERLELLDWFRPMITRSGVLLREQLQDSQLPLPGDLTHGLDELAVVHGVVADVYKMVLMKQSADLKARSAMSEEESIRHLRSLVLACYGAINHLAEQLRAIYESYKPSPPGVWREVHHIYLFAHSIINTSDTISSDGRTGMDEFFMIEHVYKRSLLLGLCNPFHFSFRQFKDLNRTLNSRASLCTIHFETMSAEKLNLFSIDFDSDYPAAPVLTHSGNLLQGEHYAVLDTRELVNSLNRDVDMIASEAFTETGEHRRADDLAEIEKLRRLIMNWGQHPVRRDTRTDQQEGECQVAAGFSEIVRHVSRNGLLLDKTASVSSEAAELSCRIIDTSPMGFQLSMKADSRIQFRIGEMIAVHGDAGPDSWHLGIIRWARYLNDDQVGIGIFILGTGCQRIRVRSENRDHGQGADCLKLTRTRSLPMNRKLMIAPSALYSPDERLEMIDGHRQVIRTHNMLLSGIDFVVFDYEFVT